MIAVHVVASSELPRIDRVVVPVGADAGDEPRTLEGTPAPEADLNNLRGAPAVPTGWEHRVYVLVPPTGSAFDW
ncbi:MAG TPA: hypothetical protein VEX39_03020 [Thermoleophilaceae bacterium]|nr:hypothetical protein [Thermoleophilaceae bacterium]